MNILRVKPRFFKTEKPGLFVVSDNKNSSPKGEESSLSKKSSKSWAFLRKYGIIEAVMKVIVKGRENRDQLEIFSIEGFVPADHLLRKIDSAVDFNHI